jgi:hypothetical protein
LDGSEPPLQAVTSSTAPADAAAENNDRSVDPGEFIVVTPLCECV